MSKLAKLVRNPGRYIPIAGKVALLPLCRVFQGTSVYLQGQMDIHPKSRWYNQRFVSATGGLYPKADTARRTVRDLEPWDNTRRDMLTLLLRTIVEKNVEGAFAELGVYQGHTAKLIHDYAPERQLHLFDTFEGFTARAVTIEATKIDANLTAEEFSDTSLRGVQAYVRAQNGNVNYHQGYFPESVPENLYNERFAFVHLDADIYESISAGLRFFYPRMSHHGVLIIHDYNAWLGARTAVDEFFFDKDELPIPMPDKSGSALVVKH
jgi:O-methyltransferase